MNNHSNWKNRSFLRLQLIAIAMLATLFVTSCSSDDKYNFKNSAEAVDACRTTLHKLAKADKMSIKELSEEFTEWRELQDTVYKVLLNDTTIMEDIEKAVQNQAENAHATTQMSERLCDDFFAVSDSIKDELTRLAFSEKRTMKDVMYLKMHTATGREEALKEKVFEDASNFYALLDEKPTYATLQETMTSYYDLLQKTKPFTKEGQMMEFIAKEDLCFRSLLVHLKDVEQSDLQNITNLTSEFFDGLTRTVARDDSNELNKRIKTYLMMRFNRRIIQNAIVCRNDVKKNARLSDSRRAMYRWMLLQPYFSIDSESMAVITKEQEKQLEEMASDLPAVLMKLDSGIIDSTTKEETEKLSGILVEYFLKSYIRMSF